MPKKHSNNKPTKIENDIEVQLQAVTTEIEALRHLVPHLPHRHLMRRLSEASSGGEGISQAMATEDALRGRAARVAEECVQHSQAKGLTAGVRRKLEMLRRKAVRMAGYDYSLSVQPEVVEQALAEIVGLSRG